MKQISYSVNDVCALLGLGRTTIYKLIQKQRLKPVKIGARTLIPASDVHALLIATAA